VIYNRVPRRGAETGYTIILSNGRLRWLRAAFVLTWIVGLAGVLSVPALRLLINGSSGDPYGDLLLALHPNNAYFHPYFYQPMQAALDSLMLELPPERTQVALVVYAGADVPDEDANAGERLQRSFAVWIYPRLSATVCRTEESPLADCTLPEGVPVITWGLADLPGYTCTAGDMGLRLCR
jgi:hypothetical protein